MTLVNEMRYFIIERETIRIKKDRLELPAPWTKDKILQENYFCNIDREDDKTTKWIRQNWKYVNPQGAPFCDIDTYEVAIVLARIFNKIEVLEKLPKPNYYLDDIELSTEDWLDECYTILRKLKDSGESIWSGAYLITTSGQAIDKLDYCFELLHRFNKNNLLFLHTTLKGAYESLLKIKGINTFLAGQIIADLKNTNSHSLAVAEDWSTFSAPGPGSLKGLSYYFDENVTQKHYQSKINRAKDELFEHLDYSITHKLCMQNLQNCFCEFGKYMTAKNNDGRIKRKYNRR